MPTPARSLANHVGSTLAIIALTGGVLTLVGWGADLEPLTDWGARGVSMQPNAAVAVVCAGLALLALPRPASRTAAAAAAVTGLLGLLTLVQHLTALDFGIDRLLLFGRTWGGHATVVPGRMGLPASTCFTLLGCSLLLATRDARARQLAAIGAMACGAIASLSIVGYLYGAQSLIALPRLTAISAQTAGLLVVVAAALLARLPDVQPTRTLVGSSAASTLVRRALPFTILVPLAVGWLRIQGERAKLYDGTFGAAMRTLVECALLLGLLAWTARAVRNHERSLAQSQRRLDGILGSISDLFLAVDRDGTLTYCNRAVQRLLAGHGVDANALLGDKPLQRHPALAASPALQPLREAFQRGREVQLELEAPAWQRWFAVRGAPTPDRGFAIVATDVTERRRAEQALRASEAELQQRMQQLREADRHKDEFLATLAHELRNPLAPIRNMLEVLRRTGTADDAVQQARTIMERQLRHVTRLIDDLLDVSRIRTGRIALRTARIDLAAVVQQALDGVLPAITAAKHRLTVSLPPQGLFVNGDPTRLAQVLGNLLDNACKYTEPGGHGHIALRVTADGDTATIRVQDNGMGVPAGMLARIFDMFTQVDRSAARAQEGLGIGLSLVKRLVEMHGGTVEAHSGGLGEGCEVVVRLPLLAAGSAEPAPVAAAPVARGCRILVVDDNRDAASSLAMLLELTGNTVRTANDGAHALREAGAFHPDVVLLDIGMPEMDGYEVARALRASPRGSQLVVVAVTGWGQDQDRQQAAAAGFDGHLVKPLEPDALARLLDRLLPPLPAR
jgi:PAS domain S-box-containing protein